MTSMITKAAAVVLTGATLLATVQSAEAVRNRYTHNRAGYAYNGYQRRGPGPGLAVAGAALGILGAATAGIAANRYYNGYPSYSYGPGYGDRYGYDYHRSYGYYGPY